MMLKQYIYTALLLLLCVESGCFLTRKTPTDYKDVVIVTEPETPPPPPVLEEKPTPPVIVAPPIGKKDTIKTEPQKPSDFIQQKSVYDIAYLLPFNVTYNNLDSANDSIYSKSILALDFWQGTQMALEEMRDAGAKLNITLLDSENTPEVVTNLFNADSSLQRYDLMIGPVYTKQLNVAADFALKHKVPMVSPLSPRVQGIVQNPYFFNANPTTTSHFKAMYDYISKHWATSDIILITSNADQDANAANELSVIFNNAAVSEHRYINIKKINSESPTFSTDLQNALAVGRENIVIAAIFEEKQAKSICSKLSGNSVILWTMPTWDSMENLNLEILESLKVHQSTSFFYDESNPEQVAFRTAYRQRYHIFPSEYACKGYDMTHYFVDLLFKKGKNISQNLASANKKGIFCDYDFVPSLLGVSSNSVIAKPDFYENKSLKIIKFEGYEYILAP